MRSTEKLRLIDKVARELQARYRYDEIDQFLAEYGVNPPTEVHYNSKWVYSKVALRGVENAKLLRIAQDLGIFSEAVGFGDDSPELWRDAQSMRIFISHVSEARPRAVRLAECLAAHSCSGFVAHAAISPTREWTDELHRALRHMEALIAVCTPGFAQSSWCQQEVGFGVARNVLIIPLHMGENPTGFVARKQAILRRGRQAEEIVADIAAVLKQDDRTKDRFAQAQQKPSEYDDDIPF
ncbi:toll/interleukin-1 receptor domain-containing protein [Salinarimonas rosea]|uniref:toll/interleukin-1 receptor domain-containing protein n=1 Tax=Salinarimonas rosea TaxID=552063 RepID=UPI0009FC5CFC|nr:toll/interleukin-1 receptor domain-containing protein [Salinarimonas rosea]